MSGVCVLDSVGALNFDSLCLLFLVVDKRRCVIYDLFQCRVFVCVERVRESVCVSVCVKERERERKRESVCVCVCGERERESMYESVSV